MMPGMRSLVISLVTLAVVAGHADAAPKKKYHFEIIAVTPKPEVKADVAKPATERVKAQFEKAMAASDQLVAKLDGAPARDASADTWRKYLAQKGIAGVYLVTVEITDAWEKIEAMPDRPGTQRLVVHVALHVLGETVPGRTMGFTGDGHATVKQEVDMKIRDKDRDYTWEGATETAVANALKECFARLDKPAKKQ